MLGEAIGVRLVVAMVFIAIGIALVNRKSNPRIAPTADGPVKSRAARGFRGTVMRFGLQCVACC